MPHDLDSFLRDYYTFTHISPPTLHGERQILKAIRPKPYGFWIAAAALCLLAAGYRTGFIPLRQKGFYAGSGSEYIQRSALQRWAGNPGPYGFCSSQIKNTRSMAGAFL